MTPKQDRAIEALNQAMRKAKRAGLSIAGVDSGLVVFDYSEYRQVAGRNGGPDLGPAEVINELDYRTLDAPYLDSGAT